MSRRSITAPWSPSRLALGATSHRCDELILRRAAPECQRRVTGVGVGCLALGTSHAAVDYNPPMRSKHHTGWAGALAVAAELSRRGYDAAITLGNTPTLDILCSSPEGVAFTVQVKTVSSPTWVLIRKEHLAHAPREHLYFAIVLVPADLDKPLVFHIMTHAAVCGSYANQPRVRRDGKPLKPGMDGIPWRDVKGFTGRWDQFPV
jgi:hypothetical protein